MNRVIGSNTPPNLRRTLQVAPSPRCESNVCFDVALTRVSSCGWPTLRVPGEQAPGSKSSSISALYGIPTAVSTRRQLRELRADASHLEDPEIDFNFNAAKEVHPQLAASPRPHCALHRADFSAQTVSVAQT